MPTIQLIPSSTTINGTTYTQLILTPVSPQRNQSKNILPKQEPLSPAAKKAEESSTKPEYPKKRIHFSKKALTHPRPQSVTRRNTRERNRVRAVNQGFVTLANHVPPHLRSKKMSKVDTLKAAIDYIQELQKTLEADSDLSDLDEQSETSTLSPVSASSSGLPSSPECHVTSSTLPSHNAQYRQSIYQPQCSQFYSLPTRGDGIRIDYTSPSTDYKTCPSPTNSFSSLSTEPFHQQTGLSAQTEDEILEFASSWLY